MRRATLVFDNLTNEFRVPERMGTPSDGQLAGAVQENLCELAGRVCFDSLGKGRPSADYHPNILKMGHTSIYEHANFTVQFNDPYLSTFDWVAACVNRPGVWVDTTGEWYKKMRLTLNLRSLLEWDKFSWASNLGNPHRVGRLLRMAVGKHLNLLPLDGLRHEDDEVAAVVPPAHDEEVWASFHFENISRSLSHELVRHKHRTAVSQRSQRYVDDGDSGFIEHPLEKMFPGDGDAVGSIYDRVRVRLHGRMSRANPGLGAGVIDKQARGAAARYLPQGIETQMVFSASVAEWKHLVSMRCSEAADAEIRALAVEVFHRLDDRFPGRFARWTKAEAKDGLGFVVGPPQ